MISRKFYPQRIIIYHIDDPCRRIDVLKYIVLNSLLVSHGIRIDTSLYIIDEDDGVAYILNGYNQRYLYAHDRSLHRYIEKIFCRLKTYPGVYLFSPKVLLSTILPDPRSILFIHTDEFHRPSPNTPPPPLSGIRKVIIVDRQLDSGGAKIFYRSKTFISTIISIHHILDLILGAWIRRRGRIERFNGEGVQD